MNELTKLDALRVYARMMNNLDAQLIVPFLADDFHYESQWVFDEIDSSERFLEYIIPKIETIRKSEQRVWAEIGELESYPFGPCVVIAQGKKNDLVAIVLVEVEAGKIKRFDMCGIPPPQSAKRTGEYPT